MSESAIRQGSKSPPPRLSDSPTPPLKNHHTTMLNRLLKLGIGGLAALTTLGAALVIVFIVIQPAEGPAWFVVARLGVAAFVVALGGLTARYLFSTAASMAQRHALLVGAIGLTAAGAAAFVWGLHLAETTGDLEAWALLISLMMAAQGAATILHLWRTSVPPHPVPTPSAA